MKKLQSHCANMTFADKSRYDRTFQQVTHKGGESAINYIKRFQNAHDLSVSVGSIYSEDQLMHTFLDHFHQGGKYSAQIASHQAEMRREEKFTDQKSLNISSLKNDYLNIDSSISGSSIHSERAHSIQAKCTFCGGKFFFSSQFCLVDCYLRRVFSTLMKVIQKCVHNLVFRIAVSYLRPG